VKGKFNMLTPEQRAAWLAEGFFVIPSFVTPASGWVMADEAIAAIRSDPPSAHRGQPGYFTAGELMIQPEAQPNLHAQAPEDEVAKIFNTHLGGAAREFALSAAAGAIASELLGEDDIDVFQSQFIFKNPGAWGQPWHQDSHYFPFDRQPQVGLWLAISSATLDNGCLSVLPGSHHGAIQPHGPDRRSGANQGYLEVTGLDETRAQPVLMEPGDLLVFHSYLLHRSQDNRTAERRAAMVYHYGVAGTQPKQALLPMQERILRWTPVRRHAQV